MTESRSTNLPDCPLLLLFLIRCWILGSERLPIFASIFHNFPRDLQRLRSICCIKCQSDSRQITFTLLLQEAFCNWFRLRESFHLPKFHFKALRYICNGFVLRSIWETPVINLIPEYNSTVHVCMCVCNKVKEHEISWELKPLRMILVTCEGMSSKWWSCVQGQLNALSYTGPPGVLRTGDQYANGLYDFVTTIPRCAFLFVSRTQNRVRYYIIKWTSLRTKALENCHLTNFYHC